MLPYFYSSIRDSCVFLDKKKKISVPFYLDQQLLRSSPAATLVIASVIASVIAVAAAAVFILIGSVLGTFLLVVNVGGVLCWR